MSGSTTGSRSSSSEDANKNSNTGGNSNRNNKRPLLLLTDGTVDWLAGWVSGAASVWVCQPVDTVLTRWQAAATSAPPIVASNSVTIGSSGGSRSIKTALHCGGPLHSYTSTSSVSLPSSGGSSSGWRAVAVDLVQTAGWRSLWRGASPMITVVPLQNGLLMGGYGWGTRYFYCNTSTRIETERNNNAVVGVKNSMLSSRTKQLCAIFVGGCTGGVLQSFLMSPVELLKVTQQCHTLRPSGDPSPRSAVSMVRLAVSRLFSTTTNGSRWRMVTSGLNATLLRDGIPHGVWFVAYDVCKNTLQSTFYSGKDFSMIGLFCGDRCAANYSHADDDAAASAPVPVAVSLTSGAVAATVAWAVGYPADLIKTRIQAATLHDTTVTTANTCDMNHKTKNGIIEIARQIIRESNGRVFAGLYRGFGLKLVRSIPASMVGFTVYEYVKEHLNALERRNRW